MENLTDKCFLCPRNCGVSRRKGNTGFCGMTETVRAARAALHMWEEPCISGDKGSGAVFFSGCTLRCIFCQNHEIAAGKAGKEISWERLSEIFLELQDAGAANLNLVTGSHFTPAILKALDMAKGKGLSLMEGNPAWHWRMPSKKELKTFKAELGITDAELQAAREG